MDGYTTIESLLGRTLLSAEQRDDEIVFLADDGTSFSMMHQQDCCEHVYIEDVCGDLSDLVGEPLLIAEEVCGDTAAPSGWVEEGHSHESYTWTFYKLATRKGYVDIRWFGSSNGYYSESVSITVNEPTDEERARIESNKLDYAVKAARAALKTSFKGV